MKVTALYVGSSLLAPLKQSEREINREYDLGLSMAAYNFGAPMNDDEWSAIDSDLQTSEIVFAIHVMDGENATKLIAALDHYRAQHSAVIVINCMPSLMRRTRMGKLDVAKLSGTTRDSNGDKRNGEGGTVEALQLMGAAGSWIGRQVKRARKGGGKKNGHGQYLKWIDRLPGVLKFVPSTGALRDVKNYLNIFCYFLQPTPANIRSMVLAALKDYVADPRLQQVRIAVPPPETSPSVAIYHPDAAKLFESFDDYQDWYRSRAGKSTSSCLNPSNTIGLLLMRPQVVSKTTKHYDELIRAIEAEGLSVISALSTLMDNREAVSKFFVEESDRQSPKAKAQRPNPEHVGDEEIPYKSRVSQIVSLTGFSFVGGPAMNDSDAAAEFLQNLNVPYRSAVSLDTQTIDSWQLSQTGLNPVQAGMQIAIPEIDGATEPFIYGGIPERGVEPVALAERCTRFARRLRRWNRLRTAPRESLKLALILFCFPPNKGNIGTAADLDVFPGLWETLSRLKAEGYRVELPVDADALREMIIGGNADSFASTANVAYRLSASEYRRLCPYVADVERDWGAAPGTVNTFGGELLIQGISLGNIFIGVQPTFGYEGDPMRLMMARSGAPHHGFLAFYTYLSQVLNVDAVVHVGTHGALEFMPGKQVGLSDDCWPDRLIGELPNIYLYSVNNPSEGSIAKRRSYAELISYLTPPIESAGLYRELATLKDLVRSYRESGNEDERARMFESISECATQLHLNVSPDLRTGAQASRLPSIG